MAMEEEAGAFREDFVASLIALGLENEHQSGSLLHGDRFEPVDDRGAGGVEVLDIVTKYREHENGTQVVHCLRIPVTSGHSVGEEELRARFGGCATSENNCSVATLSRTPQHIDVEVSGEESRYKHWYWKNVESAALDGLWDRSQKWVLPKGGYEDLVYWSVGGEVPVELRTSLQRGIEGVAASQPPDYHPNTNGVVRDHVHPSLYPYIKGVSKIARNPPCLGSGANADFWGRAYEDSVYQWLPAQFSVDGSGKCTIKSYINNLPREKHPHLYIDLERLFEIFLPHFEEVCGSVSSAGLTQLGHQLPSLMNRELQVVVKIVDYELTPGKSFEGVWHVEGMSHENIISTGLYVIERSSHLLGGDLLFKRPFSEGEFQDMERLMPQCRHSRIDAMLYGGLVPVGTIGTPEGAVIVFPNSHIHKVDMLWNPGEEFGRRRIIVFFLVNPSREIVSSRDVAPQQDVIPRSAALEHRLRLMEERKRHKQNWNVRKIELCEH